MGANASWLSTLSLAMAFACVSQTVEQANPFAGLDPLNTFLSFSTNCPPLGKAIVEVRLNPFEPSKTYEFRYQPSAFFVREYCTNNHKADGLCRGDKMCGRWENQYWYYEPGGRESFLYEYQFTSSDTNSMCYVQYLNFNVLLGLFQSSGMSDQGINTMKPSGTHLAFIDSDRQTTNAVHFQNSGIALIWVSTERWTGRMRSSYRSDLRYDTNIAPMGVPIEINVSGINILVKAITFGSSIHPTPKSDFLPTDLFMDTNIAHVSYSNREHLYSKAGKTYSMGKLPQPDLRASGKGRTFYFMGVIALVILLVPIWLVLSKRKTYS